MDEQSQDDQLEPTYSSSVPIRGVPLKTCWKKWTIGSGGERGSGISVLIARYDDDGDDEFKLLTSAHVYLEIKIESVDTKNSFHFRRYFYPKLGYDAEKELVYTFSV